jgi:murein DD-endopeptidase MepM/ murein hydrolase activator NlpD
MPKYIRPTASTAISDDFDAHVARSSANPGTDYITARGLPVVAPAAGKIVDVDPFLAGSGGRMIGLDTTDGDGFDFLHLSRIDVNVGEYVEQGQQIALTGASAWDSETGVGAHLHLSFRQRQGSHYTNSGNLDFEKYLLTPSGETGKPITTPNTEQDDTMRTIASSGRGIWLVGPNYAHHLGPDEWEQIKNLSYPHHDFGSGPVADLAFDHVRNAHTRDTAFQ